MDSGALRKGFGPKEIKGITTHEPIGVITRLVEMAAEMWPSAEKDDH